MLDQRVISNLKPVISRIDFEFDARQWIKYKSLFQFACHSGIRWGLSLDEDNGNIKKGTIQKRIQRYLVPFFQRIPTVVRKKKKGTSLIRWFKKGSKTNLYFFPLTYLNY